MKNGRVETTNLPWIVDARLLANELHIPTVLLLNDLEATAYGVTILEPTEWAVLNAGAPDAVGNAAVIAAGTGLGEAGLYWNGQRYYPFATEGGHTDFAPRSPLELELLRFLLAKFARVSYERVLSGPGLVNIYQFLRETGHGDEPAWLAEELRLHDPAAVITQAALAERSRSVYAGARPLCFHLRCGGGQSGFKNDGDWGCLHWWRYRPQNLASAHDPDIHASIPYEGAYAPRARSDAGAGHSSWSNGPLGRGALRRATRLRTNLMTRKERTLCNWV